MTSGDGQRGAGLFPETPCNDTEQTTRFGRIG